MTRFWMSAECDAKVYDDFRVIRSKIETDIKSILKQDDFGKGLKRWFVLPIVLSVEAKRDVFPEVRNVDLKKRECEFRLHVPLTKFRRADMPAKYEMIKDVILCSLILTEEAGIESFDFAKLRKQITSLRYIPAQASPKTTSLPSKPTTKAKTKPKNRKAVDSDPPTWKTNWPRGGNLRAWLRCMLEKCEAFDDVKKGADAARLPIDALAELRQHKEALKYVRRFLKKLPNQSDIQTVMMLELGAEIELRAGDLERANKWLDQVLQLDNSNARKCDRDFPQTSVLDFKILHGLANPAEIDDERQAERAAVSQAERLATQCIEERKLPEARKHITSLEEIAKATDDEFHRSLRLQSVLDLHAALNDSAAVKRTLRRMGKEDRESAIPYTKLYELGLHPEAVRRAERQIDADLEELASMDDPNIHFPTSSLCDSIEFLADRGEITRARRKLKRTLKECADWPIYEYGWTTATVYTMLARAVSKIDGPEAATEFVESAYEDASAEKRPDWRKASTRTAIALQADLGYLDEALVRARKLRSPRERLFETAKLLAQARRWKELREVCQSVRSPAEAADLCWAIKFQLSSGEPRP